MMVGALGAQKSKDIGFVDSDVILAKMPEYRAAQKDLDDLGAKYQGEAQQLQTALDQMIRDFQSEEILLTTDQRRQKKEAIAANEAELIQYREAKFGPTGELYQERARCKTRSMMPFKMWRRKRDMRIFLTKVAAH